MVLIFMKKFKKFKIKCPKSGSKNDTIYREIITHNILYIEKRCFLLMNKRNQMQVVMPDDTLDEYVSSLFTYDLLEELADNGMVESYIDELIYDCIDNGYSEEWCWTELKQRIVDEYNLYDYVSLVNELSGDVEEYNKFIEAIKKISTVPIKFAEIDTSAKGYYNIEDKCIVIKDNMSEVQTAKTLIHEIAHSILHEKDTGIEKEADRNTKEVQAESVAYATCQHFNIDTTDYSFGYIAGWSSGKEVEELRNSMNVIRQTASDLINGIEKNLSMLMEKENDYSITFFATSNAEYPDQGEMYETENIDEAIDQYKKMIDNHSNGMSGIGFTYNSKDKEDIYNESQMMLVSVNKLCLNVLDIDKFKDIEEIKFSINSIQNKIPHLINPTEQKTHSKGKSR